MAYDDFRRDDQQRYEARNAYPGSERGRSQRDEWRDASRSYEPSGSYASRQRDYYSNEDRFRGSQRLTPGGEYVGNRAPSYWPQRYDSDNYINQSYGENRGRSDWRTEDGLFAEPQDRGVLDGDYERNYGRYYGGPNYGINEDRSGWGYGGYARDMDYGRRGTFGYGGFGRAEYGTAAYGYGSQPYRSEHRGKGPKGYRRSDERIREDVCDLLSDDPRIDASNLEVTVKDCEVTLAGTVNSRQDKRLAEDLAERIGGVKDVHNTLRVAADQTNQSGKEQSASYSARH